MRGWIGGWEFLCVCACVHVMYACVCRSDLVDMAGVEMRCNRLFVQFFWSDLVGFGGYGAFSAVQHALSTVMSTGIHQDR